MGHPPKRRIRLPPDSDLGLSPGGSEYPGLYLWQARQSEVQMSRQVAAGLGIPWEFVPYTPDTLVAT